MTDVETSGYKVVLMILALKSLLWSLWSLVIDIHDAVEVLMECTQMDDKRPSTLQKQCSVNSILSI